jgi:hypothetical protein
LGGEQAAGKGEESEEGGGVGGGFHGG